jgi:ABC-type Mn2+/Zn2+ transport system permease subunit
MIGVVMLSIVCGILSPIVVAKKYAFMAPAISHSTILGVALTLLCLPFSHTISLFLGTLGFTCIFVYFLARASHKGPLPSDSLIGIFLSTTMALGLIIHYKYIGGTSDLFSLLFGNILLLDNFDLLVLFFLFLMCLILVVRSLDRWIYFSFDPQGAKLSGVRTKLYHYGLFFLLTCLIVGAVKISGTILVSSLLILPGTFAYKFSKNMSSVFKYSVIFAVLSGILGLFFANSFGWPPAPALALTQFLLFLPFGLIPNKN